MTKTKTKFSVGDRVLVEGAGGQLFRAVVVAVDSRTWVLKMTQRPDANGRIEAVNAEEICARAAAYQSIRPNVSWPYHSSVPFPNTEPVEFKTDRGDTRFADTRIRISRRGADRSRIRPEPAMSLEAAKATLENEGAVEISDLGLLKVATRPSSDPGRSATATIRWVGDGDLWEICGWTS